MYTLRDLDDNDVNDWLPQLFHFDLVGIIVISQRHNKS